jgi:hypothetical protein
VEPLAAGDPWRVGPYRLRARLGSGGMGQVFLGSSPAGRAVAVKVIHPGLAKDPMFRTRFRREVAAAKAVSGAYTAPVTAAGPDDDPPWLATAFVPVPSLAGVIAAAGPLPSSATGCTPPPAALAGRTRSRNAASSRVPGLAAGGAGGDRDVVLGEQQELLADVAGRVDRRRAADPAAGEAELEQRVELFAGDRHEARIPDTQQDQRGVFDLGVLYEALRGLASVGCGFSI